MKKLCYIMLTVLVALSACQEDALEPQQTHKPNTPPSLGLNIDQMPSAIYEGNRWYYAGYGYNPATKHESRLAIAPHNMYQTSQIQEPLKVEMRVINTNEQLSNYTKITGSSKGSLGFKWLSLGRSSKRVIENLYTLDRKHVLIIAKIESRVYKHLVDGTPTLSAQAQQYKNKQQYNNFLADYGTMYVNSQTLGGAVYYVYHYDVEKVTNVDKTFFAKTASFGIKKIFGLSGGRELTTEERRMIERAELKVGITSTVPGHAPGVIQNVSDLNREIGKLQNYLNQYPQRASTMDIELKSYEQLVPAPAIRNAYRQQMACFDKWTVWNNVKDKLTHIKNTTQSGDLRGRAGAAIKVANDAIQKAEQCNGGVPAYQNNFPFLMENFALEQKSHALLRYHHHGIYSHFYRTWDGRGPIPVLGGAWRYEGDRTGRLLMRPEAGTKPLKRYYSGVWSTHAYSTGGPPAGHFGLEGTIGHVYTSPGKHRVPLYGYRRHTGGVWLYFYTNHNNGVPYYERVGLVGYIVRAM